MDAKGRVERVVPPVDLEVDRRLGHHAGRRGDIAGGVLDGHDVRHLAGQLDGQVRSDPAARPHRDVVQHHRQWAGRGHGAEVGRQAGRGRTVVVRGHHEDTRRPGGRGLLGHVDGVGGVVGSGPGDDRDGDRLDDRPEQVDPLGVGQHRAFAGGAGHHECSPLPVSARWRATAAAASRSRAPSGPKGVTMAVTTEPKRAPSSCGPAGRRSGGGSRTQATSRTDSRRRSPGGSPGVSRPAEPGGPPPSGRPRPRDPFRVRPARAGSGAPRPWRRTPRRCRRPTRTR